MNRKNKLRVQYFKEHNIDEKYKTIENEVHHIIEWNEAEKGLVSKQEVNSIGNLLLISKNKHTIITAKTNQFRESNIGQVRKEPPRKYYKITEGGKRTYVEMLRQWKEFSTAVNRFLKGINEKD